MIIFEGVTKLYDNNVVGLQDCSFHIPKGEFVFLVGPSGSGKSTLIKLVLKELEPTKGRVIVAGKPLAALRRSRVPLLRRNIGCVFQDFKLLPNKSVYDNVAYALEVVGEPRRSIRKKVPEILKLVGLYDKMNNRPSEISGGEEQRVSIARAFVNHPPLLLADEPTGNLDPDTSVDIMQLLERINRTGTTVVVATHDREMVNRMRKRVFALDGGRLVRDERRGVYADTTEMAAIGASVQPPAPYPTNGDVTGANTGPIPAAVTGPIAVATAGPTPAAATGPIPVGATGPIPVVAPGVPVGPDGRPLVPVGADGRPLVPLGPDGHPLMVDADGNPIQPSVTP